jgi:hypothetical protein
MNFPRRGLRRQDVLEEKSVQCRMIPMLDNEFQDTLSRRAVIQRNDSTEETIEFEE